MPPALYAAIPLWMKRWLLLEFKLYETDWNYGAQEDVSGSDAVGRSVE